MIRLITAGFCTNVWDAVRETTVVRPMSFIAKLGGSENCFIIPRQTPSYTHTSQAHTQTQTTYRKRPPHLHFAAQLNLSRGTGCPVEQHRWCEAGPPRDLKRRLSLAHTTSPRGSQCVKFRHSIKYDSSSNLLSHFHHRPTSRLLAGGRSPNNLIVVITIIII